MNKKQCIVIAGPTSVGKTEISLSLAERLNGAIVSADSMQVYKGMDIGSAKIPEKDRRGIPHYLIDVLEPEEDFHVVKFQQMAKAAMNDIYSKGMIPVITGGTGFYIQAVIKDIDFTETGHVMTLRGEYAEIARIKGPETLHELLKEKDPDAAESIHPNNIKRVIRALEFYDETGKMISGHNSEQKNKISPYKYGYFVLNDDRELLYKRINERVDEMISEGLEDEVRGLYNRGLTADHISMKGIGYREFFPYFEGRISLKEAIEMIKRDTRHFAKRQVTWFKRESDAIWFERQAFDNSNEKIVEAMIKEWRRITAED